MMNFPGVIHGDANVMSKIAAAKKYGKPVGWTRAGAEGIRRENLHRGRHEHGS
jgi:adenine deaminase